jgi:hypothetical protein
MLSADEERSQWAVRQSTILLPYDANYFQCWLWLTQQLPRKSDNCNRNKEVMVRRCEAGDSGGISATWMWIQPKKGVGAGR